MKMFNIKHSYPVQDLPAWLWFYMPLGLFFLQFITAVVLDDRTYTLLMEGEFGFVENLTVAFLLVAITTGVLVFRQRRHYPFTEFKIFILLFIAGCIYFAGEELSWGQHYLGWEAPESIAAINKQNETNLHNIHKIFGVFPKIILEWTIYLTGVFCLVRVYRGSAPYHPGSHWQFWYLPTYVVIVTSILAFMYRVVDRIENWFHLDYLIDPDEMHECLIAIFLMLYMISIYRRLMFHSRESRAVEA